MTGSGNFLFQSRPSPRLGFLSGRRTILCIALTLASSLALASGAQADPKTVVGWIGTPTVASGSQGGEFSTPRDVAVNETGAGGVAPGTFYTAENGRVQMFTPDGDFVAAWGQDVQGVSEVQVLTINADGGSYTLSFEGDTTLPIAWNALAAVVDERLGELPSIGGAANVNVTGCSGNSCDRPFTRNISFVGTLAGTDVPQITADGTGLTDSSGANPTSISVATQTNGGGGTFPGFEICTQASICSLGVTTPPAPAINGALDGSTAIEVDQTDGSVYVADRDLVRIQKYSATGEPLLVFGRDVNQTIPGTLAEVCTAASEDICKTGVNGTAGGELTRPSVGSGFGLAIVPPGLPNSGNVLVADPSNRRFQEFTKEGEWVRAVGWDVVMPGKADNIPTNEVQEVELNAVGGTFTLTFSGQTTAPIPFDASPEQVEAALIALSNIDDVNVTGGPGDATGTSPYAIEFDGSLADQQVATLVANGDALITPIGKVRSCTGPTTAGPGTLDSVEFQWLRNGSPIPGATESTYTATAADEGKVVQCQTIAQSSGGEENNFSNSVPADTGSVQASIPYAVVGTATGTAPPNPPATLPHPTKVFEPTTENLVVGADGGAELVCEPGSWTGSPSFTYRWYRNGIPLSGNGANTKTYTVQTADLATPALFQCAVTATNAGGSVTKMTPATNNSQAALTSPRPSPIPPDTAVLDGLTTVTTVEPGAAFEVCTISADCKAGAFGEVVNSLPVGEWPAGQFSEGQFFRLAVDSTGAIYTTDRFPVNRALKFVPDDDPPGLIPSVFGTAGAPNGVDETTNDQLLGVTITSDGNVAFQREYEAGSPPICANDAVIPQDENRIQELTPDGSTLLETHMGCAGLVTGNEDIEWSGHMAGFLVPTRTTGHRVMFIDDPLDPILGVAEPAPTSVSATISGVIDPMPGGYPNAPSTSFQVEYKPSSSSEWIKYLTPTDIGNSAAPVPYTVTIYPLLPNSDYDVRVVARKEFNSAKVTSEVQHFTTLEDAPEVESFNATDVRADSADLNAIINPRGSDTSYYFEYGKTPEFGNKVPVNPESIGAGQDPVKVTKHLEGLDPVPYFFRVVAESSGGKTVTVSQSFNFYPETCPNADLRQQTGAAYLPDCRAYEIASPEYAGGTVLYTWTGPATGQATNPSRLSFLAAFGGIPDTGDPPGTGEMYVATRTDNGWKTKHVGLPAKEAFQSGFLPTELTMEGLGARSTSRIPASPSMDRFAVWNWGYVQFTGQPNPYVEFSPYILDHEANLIERWPTNLDEFPGSANFASTQVKVSEDFSTYVFNSDKPFAPGGIPGDFYANDTVADTVEIVSRDPEGNTLEGKGSILDVSEDGSRVLLSKEGYTPCTKTFGVNGSECNPHVPPSVFYMRAEGSTYDVTDGHLAKFQGMSGDGSKVYFLSDEQVTADDADTSTDLFVWYAESDSIERVSAGVGGAGNSDLCTPVGNWTPKCSVLPISYLEQSSVNSMESSEPEFFHAYSKIGKAGEFGNGISDNFVSSDTGDIMFFSPEQLTGTEGVDGRANLYLFRHGELDFVASFDVDRVCHDTEPGSVFNRTICSDSQIGRIQMSPDGRFTAFTAMSRLTGFDNNGKEVMYRYDAESDELLCVSCPQDGSKPQFHVRGSTNGLFMTDDGRVFFATKDAVVPPDTNEGLDIYEFVGGRPQLISNGLAPEDEGIIFGTSPFIREGLVGVSADGTDVFFATRATLTPQDRNGGNMKIYDARVNGGFPVEPASSPCAAADECHAGSSVPPPPLVDGSSADRGPNGGNVVAPRPRKASGRKTCRVKKRGKRARRACAKRRKRAAKRKNRAAKRRAARPSGRTAR